MLWRVGDGSQIRVFHDNWILGCFPTKAIPHTQDIEDDSNACSLIDQTTRDWNGQMIDQKIAPFMAQRLRSFHYAERCKETASYGRRVKMFIWGRRNKCHFNEQNLPPEKILEAAVALLAKFQGKSYTRLERKKTQTQRWSPPTQGTYKANYDGAYFTKEEKVGIGVVVRNKLGQVMGSLAEKIDMPSIVEVLKAMAARRAMIFMEELGLR
nr:hypothetical protein CFP56_14668 [Quercus suber]